MANDIVCKCPECGSDFDIHEAEIGEPVFRQGHGFKRANWVEEVRRKALVAFCQGCEFSVEIKS